MASCCCSLYAVLIWPTMNLSHSHGRIHHLGTRLFLIFFFFEVNEPKYVTSINPIAHNSSISSSIATVCLAGRRPKQGKRHSGKAHQATPSAMRPHQSITSTDIQKVATWACAPLRVDQRPLHATVRNSAQANGSPLLELVWL